MCLKWTRYILCMSDNRIAKQIFDWDSSDTEDHEEGIRWIVLHKARISRHDITIRSSTSNQPSPLVTVGERSFVSAGPKLWNSLPDDITSASFTDCVIVCFGEYTFISAVISGHYVVACLGLFSPRHGGPSSYLLRPLM